MAKGKKLSLKQKRFADDYLKTGNATEAVSRHYNVKNRNSARAIADQNLHKPLVKSYISKKLDKAGLTDEYIADKIYSIVDAGTSQRALRNAKPQDAARMLEFSGKLKDHEPVHRVKTESASLNLSLEGKSEDDLRGMLLDIEKEMREFRKMMIREELKGKGAQEGEILE